MFTVTKMGENVDYGAVFLNIEESKTQKTFSGTLTLSFSGFYL